MRKCCQNVRFMAMASISGTLDRVNPGAWNYTAVRNRRRGRNRGK